MFLMVAVTRTKGQSKDSILRRFVRMVMEEEIVDEVRSRMFYRSPSEIKKEKNKEIKRRHRHSRSHG
jgi:ribosomal protein S21